MWLLRERLSILQWNILHRVDSLTYTPKNSNHLRSHSGTIMALDHRSQSIFRLFKKFPKSPIRPAGCHFWRAPNFQWTLKELRFNIIKNLLCLFFLLNGFITMCNLKKRLIRAAFWVLLQAMFMNDWKQTARISDFDKQRISKPNLQ